MSPLAHARPPFMPTHLFVYGTLKEGFPNFHLNGGRRVVGHFRTRERFPFYVVQLPTEHRAPWLLNSPGEGLQVVGQVFEVDPAQLAEMDVFEEVHLTTGYVRVPVELEATHDATARLHAHAYLKRPTELPQCLAVEGPFAEYTLALAEGYWITDSPAVPPHSHQKDAP
ncbi:MAG: gamma-glutamylcyclotransferase [Polaromonas sp.]|nr:gamma-glutamylcyclotransferase [Polaromonas sp.]